MSNAIKYEYMVTIELPVPFDNEFISLIPAQRQVINKLMLDKVISSYAVSIEDGKLWTTIIGETEEEVIDVLEKFPIIMHVEYSMSRLAFHNVGNMALPQFSLN